MADIQSNIHVNIDTSDALASLKLLQRQISAFHTQMAKSGTAASAVAANQAQNLMNSINATGQFQASMRTVTSSTESFTDALEKNKLTSREYFRYTGAATKTFGRFFKSEFETINKVARERVKDIQTQYIKMGRGANGALQAISVRPLTLDMQNLGTQTAMAAQRQQLLNQLLKQGSTNLLNFGKNTQWAGRQLMVGFTVPLVLLGSTAAKTFMQLEEQAIRFKRVYGELFTTADETDAMVKDIQRLAREYTKYGVAVEETMKMAADAAAQGKMGADLMAQVAQATRLAVLGGVEQEQALETTISVTNAFGVATEDLAKKIDFLNAVENQTVVSIEDLTIAIPKAGPVVQQLGGDVEDLAFFLTAMKEGGINASEGANALKSGLASLINPSEKASKMLQGLGINIKGIVEANAGDVTGTVVEFSKALDTLDPLNRARAIEQLFGKFQFSRLSTLFQNVTAQGTQASRVLGLARATTEELAILSERELSKIENTTTYKFKKSIEDLKVTIAPVGEQFLKALTPIVEFAAKILDKFNDLGDGSKKFLTILTVALGAVGPVALMAFGLLANGVANIIKMFTGLRSVFNRAGSSTQVLGQQTNYLTQEQLEASAVAASLDQVHQRLKQTFTSEATAVNMLANAYRNAISAQLGFTGPVKGGSAKSQSKKKYSNGTIKVPGIGNKDTIPAMLTPGEAVIPAGAAQNPANKPAIARMIAGQTVQGFNGGTPDATEDGKEKPVKVKKNKKSQSKNVAKKYPVRYRGQEYNAATAQSEKAIRDFIDTLIENPDGTLTYVDEDPKKSGTFTKQRLSDVLSDRTKEGQDFNVTNIKRSLNIGSGKRGRGISSNSDPLTGRLMKKVKKQNKTIIDQETMAIEEELKRRGVSIDKGDRKQIFGLQASHIVEDVKDGVKVFKAPNIVPDSGYVNNYINTIKASLGQELLDMPDDRLKDLGIDRSELEKLARGEHPTTQASAETIRNVARYDIEADKTRKVKKDTLYQAHLVDAGIDYRLKNGTYTNGLKSLVEMFPTDKGVVSQKKQALMEKIANDSKNFTDNERNKGLLTNYGKLISPTSGRSFPVDGIGGLYEKPDGTRVFVKPMLDEVGANAEVRGTQIARDVHGLEAPEQTIKTMVDPTDKTGQRKIIVLESPYDEAFDERKMSRTFTREQYIRQLLAAGLRGDKDLKRGNLGGNVLTDVGPAGVFEKASGARDLAEKMPSVFEMTKTNVREVPGKSAGRSPFWFSNTTADIAKSMTAQEFADFMDNEIDKVLPKLRETVKSFNLIDPPDSDQSPQANSIRQEKKAYDSMLARLEEAKGQPWKEIHKLHTSVAIKPDEVLEDDKTGKTRKPKSERLPSNVKSTGGPKDTRMATEPEGKSIVQKPKKAGKIVMRGKANAPESQSTVASAIVAGAESTITKAKTVGELIGKTISQKAQGASRTALYGTGPVDAESKSVRRQLQKLKKQEEKKQKIAAASRTQFYGTGPVNPVEKSKRRNAELQMKRSQLAEKTAYRKSVIAQNAAEEARKRSVSGRLQTFSANRDKKKADRLSSGKGPGMGMTGGVMAASGVAMMASMLPGQVGEMATKIMMPLMGISMIMPMLQNKFTALAAGIGLAVAAYAYQRMVFDKAQDAAMKLTEAMGSGSEAMKSLSTFAGKVSAGEIMDRRRKDSFSPFQIKTGKTTFGQSFMAGEQGKSMLQSVGQTVRSSGKDVAKGQVVNQLATAVASGALDAGQARSIVANLAQEMGDYSFGIEVNGKLTQLLGPNGENILKDPLGVRIKLLQDTREKMNLSTDATKKAAGFTGKDAGKSVGYTALGAGVGAVGGALAVGGLGALIGSLGGPAGAAIGAALGSKIGVGIGATIGVGLGSVAGNLFGRKDRNKRIGEASGASVAMQKIALQQQQELTDSVELQYQNELAAAKAAGNTAEIKRLTKQYELDQVDLLTENGKLVKDIQNSYANADGATRGALMTGADKAITKQYKGTAMEDVVPLAQQQINDSGISKEMQYTLKMEMGSGQIDPMQMIEIFDTFGKDKATIQKVVSIVGKFGGKFANQMMGIVGMFKDPKQATKFVADISTKTAPEAQKQLELFQRISQLNAAIPEISVALDYYNKNPIAAAALQKTIDKIDETKGKISLQIATSILGAKEMEILKADQEYFNSLPAQQQKVYLQTLTTMVNMEGNNKEAIQNWLKANPGKTEGDYYRASVYAVTESSVDKTSKPPKGNGSVDEDKKIQSSPLDDLVKKLRDVRNNTIKVTEGFGASSKALNKLFGGSKTISIFSGIENDMRGLGAGEDLIDLITGMDPKEYEERKNSLFKFDKGNIVGLKDNARSIGDAIQSIKLGDFVSEQEKMSKQIGNQTTALTRLKAAGVEGSVALEAVSDATFAASIANKNLSDAQIKKIVAAWKEATKQKKNYAAVQTIEQERAALQERVTLLQRMTELSSILNQDQRDAIMASSELQSILTNLASIKPGDKYFDDFIKLLEETLNKNRVELKIKQLSLGDLQNVFDDGFNAAMDKADVDEKTIRLRFEAETQGLQDSINLAQDEIAAYQYSIDDQEAMLRGIEKQEEKINDKYDDRIEALDEVEKANAAISAQQKGQLTLAEALTSGDIAAAAKAAQDMRAQAAADAVTKEKEALQKSREYELSQVRQDGKSRKDLEKEIERLQDLVYAKEEVIEKDQEAIRQKEVTLRKDMKPIEATRTDWETLQNQIDIARTSNERFLKLMTDAKAVVEKLKQDYAKLKIDTDPIIPAGAVAGAVVGATGNEECLPGYIKDDKGNCVPVDLGFDDIPPAIVKKITPETLINDRPGKEDDTTSEANARSNAIFETWKKEKAARELAELVKIVPSKIAAGESGSVGAASIAAQLKAANAAKAKAADDAEKLRIKNSSAAALQSFKEAEAKQAVIDSYYKRRTGGLSMGGLVPKYFALGGFARGTDTVPAMLTPGEFVMSKYAVDSYGVENLKKINNGDANSGAVYNNTYALTVNAKTNANPNEIAQAVMSTIKRVDDRRIRGVAING